MLGDLLDYWMEKQREKEDGNNIVLVEATGALNDSVPIYKLSCDTIAVGNQEGKLGEVLFDLSEGHGSVSQVESI